MLNARQAILDQIQKAADKAAEKNVQVKVEYTETGFMGDRIEVTVTATPQKQGSA